MVFSNYFEHKEENTLLFLETIRMDFLIFGHDDEATKLRAFPLVLREEAKVCYQTMGALNNWER